MFICSRCNANALPPGHIACVCAKSLWSCSSLCDPMDCSPPACSVHGILQARTLEWVAISFSSVSSWPRDQTCLYCIDPTMIKHVGSPYVVLLLLLLLLSRFSCVRLCETPQTAAHQAPLSLGFSRQEHWSGLPFPSPMHESEK